MNNKQKKKCQRIANRHRPNYNNFIKIPMEDRKGNIIGYWYMIEPKKDENKGIKDTKIW